VGKRRSNGHENSCPHPTPALFRSALASPFPRRCQGATRGAGAAQSCIDLCVLEKRTRPRGMEKKNARPILQWSEEFPALSPIGTRCGKPGASETESMQSATNGLGEATLHALHRGRINSFPRCRYLQTRTWKRKSRIPASQKCLCFECFSFEGFRLY